MGGSTLIPRSAPDLQEIGVAAPLLFGHHAPDTGLSVGGEIYRFVVLHHRVLIRR